MAKRSAPSSASDGTASKKAARGGNATGSSDGRGKSGGAGRRMQQDMSPNSGTAAAAGNSNSAGDDSKDEGSRSASPNPSAEGSDTATTPAGANSGAASGAGNSSSNAAAGTKDTEANDDANSTTTTSRPPSRLSTRSSPDDKNGSGKPPRETQVTELLAHRRLLLERIRQCRAAAALRLQEEPARSVASMSNAGSNTSTSSGSGNNAESEAAAPAEEEPQPANEIEAFKLLTQQAITATRKERQSSVAAAGGSGRHDPPERGLRRGGSVGKRMAAAVSTLQNAGSIGGWVSDSSTGTGASGSTGAAAATAGGGGGSKSAKTEAASAGGGSAAASASTATAVSLEGGGKKGKKRPKASESPPPSGAGSSEASAAASSMAAAKTKKTKSSSSSGGGGGDRDKKKKGGGSGQSGASGSSASQQQSSSASAAAMRQHHQNALAALGQSDPETLALISRPRGQEARILKQYAANPRVVHPRGRSLRARRDALRDRLEKMVTERRDREARWLGQGLQRSDDGSNIGATAPPPPTGGSPTSVAEKMAGSKALKELVKSRPQFKAYALDQSSAAAAASAGSQPLSRASTPPPAGPGLRSPVPSSQPYRPEPRNPSSSSRPTPRRKTHWDYVLEEMKWTATDFESERRWKGAVGRTLGASVLAFHASNGGGKGSPLKSAKSAGTAAKGPGGSTKKKKRKTEGSEDDPATVAEIGEEDLEPTVEDLDRARIIAKGLSVLIAGHWELAAGEIASSASGSSRDVASSDGTKFAGLSDGSTNASVIYRRYMEAVKGVPGMGDSKTAKRICAPTSDDKEDEDRSSSNPSHETVTARLEAAIKRANLVGTQPSKKKRPVESADCTVDLQPSQVDAIHFVEAVWEVGSDDDAPTLGVALSGKVASGKTVAMAAAIWRHGDEGPQILFCHAARLIRWRHELRRFGNLNVLTYGNLGWQFDSDQEQSFKAGDVILCEFSSLPDFLANVGKGVVSGAATITVDSRCPQSDAVAQRSSGGVSLQQASSSAIALPEVASSEVTSTKWWKHLLHALTPASMGSKRLLIEGPTSLEEVLAETPSSSNQKKRVELLAMKMAYIHHPRTFCAGHGNVGRSVISWAKKHHRGNAPSEPTAKTDLGALKNVLHENLSALCHTQEMYEQPKSKKKPPPSWELRLCTFPALQLQAYEECCSFVRGSLTLSSLRLMGITASSTASRAQRNAQTLWAQAILRLRRVCVHSNLDEAAQITPLSTSSSSQLEDAKKILMNSAKMQELTSVLLTECGHEIGSGEFDDELLSQILPDTSTGPAGGAAKKTKRKKVLILASLPEAQTVVSKLLTSLGIAHGKLRSSSSSSSEADPDIATKEGSIIDSLAWIENQHILSRFNTRVDATVSSGAANRALPSSACDVLLASPSTIGSQYGGLSASSADVVISLDEDWSGHSQRLIESILARNLMHHCLLEDPSSSKPRPKWIKLVCDDSCEKIFLFPEGGPTKSNQDEADDVEPEDSSPPKKKQKRGGGGGRKGRKGKAAEKVVEKKATPSKASGTSQGSPATYISCAKVLQFRNKALTTVLGKHCSIDESQFPDPSDSIFLPSLLGEESNNLPAADDAENNPTLKPFSNALLHEEALASSFLAGVEDSTESNVPVAALSSLTISRRDVSSICVRTYVQQLARALSSSSSGSNKQPSMLIANGAAGRLRLSGSDTDLADSWRNSGLGSDPIEVAASTLSLRPEIILKDDSVNIGLYALAHTELGIPTVMPIHDGSEGQDELVYFPPSFPGMLPNAYRKMAEEEQRKRAEKKSAAASDAVSTTSSAGVSAFMGGKQAGSKGKRARNSKGGRSSTAAPLTPTALTNINSSASPSANNAAEDFESTLDMAFGMPGLPDSRISAQSAAKTLTGCLSYPYLDEDAVDFGDTDACPEMGSMLLFTKKGTNLLRRASSLMPTYGAYGMQAAAAGGKKPKKGLPQQQPSMGMQPNNGGPPPGSDSMQTTGQIWDSRALNLLAQRGINPHTTLRHASVRMRHRLNDRVTQLFITTGTSLGTGHGVPQLYANEFAAILGNAASRHSLKRALNAPCRTDFGPFNVGFLASKDGMVGIKTKKRKLGITLPMGVRIPQHRDNMMRPFPRSGADADEEWSKGEDEKLIESVLRWKDNWHLISNSVSHMSSGVNVWEKGGRYQSIRSPTQCRERWAILIRSRPDLQMKWTAVETSVGDLVVPGGAFKALRNALAYSEAHPPVALSSSDKDASAEGNGDADASKKPKEKVIGIIQTSLLLRRAVGDIVAQAKQDLSEEKTVLKKTDHLGSDGADKTTESSTPQPDQADDSAPAPSPDKASIGSRLAKMKRAMSKRQRPKLQVPGAPPGASTQAVPLVGSHPSHAQAVEYAVTQATGASGMAPPRMEMWPLQILDYADRVRSAKTGEPLPTPRRARSSGSTAGSSQRPTTSAGTSPTPSTRQAPPMITTPHGAMQPYQRVPGQQSYPPAPQRTAIHGASASSQGVPTRGGGGPIGSYLHQMPPHGSGSGIPKPTVVGATGVPIQPANQNAPPPPAPAAPSSASASAAATTASSNRHVPPLPPTAGNGGRPSAGAAAPAGPAAGAQNTSGAAAKSPAPASSPSQPPPSTQK